LRVQFSSLFAVRKVFPDLEFLGWYSTGKEAQVSDLDIHKQVRRTSLN